MLWTKVALALEGLTYDGAGVDGRKKSVEKNSALFGKRVEKGKRYFICRSHIHHRINLGPLKSHINLSPPLQPENYLVVLSK